VRSVCSIPKERAAHQKPDPSDATVHSSHKTRKEQRGWTGPIYLSPDTRAPAMPYEFRAMCRTSVSAVRAMEAVGLWLRLPAMTQTGDVPRDLAWLVAPRHGRLEPTRDLFMPYRLVDADGVGADDGVLW
jgi:hypothetical protein